MTVGQDKWQVASIHGFGAWPLKSVDAVTACLKPGVGLIVSPPRNRQTGNSTQYRTC